MFARQLTLLVLLVSVLFTGALFAQDPPEDPFGGGFAASRDFEIFTLGVQNDSLHGWGFDWLDDLDSLILIGDGLFPESFQCGLNRDVAAADFNGDYLDEMAIAWNRTDGGVFVGILTIDPETMEPDPAGWSVPDTPGSPGVLYASEVLADFLGDIRVVTGNFYDDPGMEFVLAYLAADSTVHLSVFDVDSATLIPEEMAIISDQDVNTQVPQSLWLSEFSRFDVTTGDFDSDGLDEIILVINDPIQTPETDIVVAVYDYDTLGQAINPVAKIPFTANDSLNHTCLRTLIGTSGNFDTDSRDEIAIMHRWVNPEDDALRVGDLHILKLNPEMTEISFAQNEELPAVPPMVQANGMEWIVQSLTVYDNDLVAGGKFDSAGGVSANCIARLDGSGWHPLGSGMDDDINDGVKTMAVYNNDLIAGGRFQIAGGVTVNNIARWDGASWHALGSGVWGDVEALTIYNGDLIAAGSFVWASGVRVNNIARWDGFNWDSLGSGLAVGNLRSLAVYGDDLFVGGTFLLSGDTCFLARWDGSNWHKHEVGPSSYMARSMTVYNDELIIGGDFTIVDGETATNIARWDGANWYSLGSGPNSDQVYSLAVYNDELIAGGWFTTIDAVNANSIARWDGSTWAPLDEGVDYVVNALDIYNGNLIAGGTFTTAGESSAKYIARWDGSDWFPFVPSSGLPMDIASGDIHENIPGENLGIDELFISACRTNGNDIEKYLKGYAFDTAYVPASYCSIIDTVIESAVADENLPGDLFTSRRTMDMGYVTGEDWSDLAILLAGNGETRIDVFRIYPDTGSNCGLIDSLIIKNSWSAGTTNMTELVLADLDTSTIFLGRPKYYHVDSIVQPLVVLNTPPVHYDIVNDTVWNLSKRYPQEAGYETYSIYANRQSMTYKIETVVRRDWGVSAGLKTEHEAAGVKVKAHLNTKYGEGFSIAGGNSTTLSIYMGEQAVSNDWILASTTGFDVWEYPVYRGGQRLVNGDVIIVDPTGPVKKWLNSKETDSWIEDHEVENILSYPKYDPLDPSDNLAQDNPMVADSSVIQGVTKLMSPPSGDGSYWALMSSEFGESTIEESNNFGVEIGASLELSGGLEFFGVKIKSSFEASVEGTYDQSEVNTYTTTFSSGDSLHVQYGGIDTDGTYAENRKYEITPHAYWGRNGALVLDYGSNPAANQSPLDNTWWQDHYSDPDPAFLLPWRLDPEKLGVASDDNRFRTKEMIFIPANPAPGEEVRIIARVHNLSLNPTDGPVAVSFCLGSPQYNRFLIDQNSGDSVFYTCDILGSQTPIASRGSAFVELVWQVPSDIISSCPKIWAIIDPQDEISPEVHDNDDLRTNNKGWKILYLDAPGVSCIDIDSDQHECGDANGDMQANVGDAVFVINYVFKGGAAPDPLCLGDANGDSQTNVGDAVYLIGYVFRGGPAPVEPCCE